MGSKSPLLPINVFIEELILSLSLFFTVTVAALCIVAGVRIRTALPRFCNEGRLKGESLI